LELKLKVENDVAYSFDVSFVDSPFEANKCGALKDSKKGCPLLILVHCILIRFRVY
jgi:hypothetical protein